MNHLSRAMLGLVSEITRQIATGTRTVSGYALTED
jgi:hypothetical protein